MLLTCIVMFLFLHVAMTVFAHLPTYQKQPPIFCIIQNFNTTDMNSNVDTYASDNGTKLQNYHHLNIFIALDLLRYLIQNIIFCFANSSPAFKIFCVPFLATEMRVLCLLNRKMKELIIQPSVIILVSFYPTICVIENR